MAGDSGTGSVFGTTRLPKNVMGLWLPQECHRVWARKYGPMEYDTVVASADDVPAHAALIDPDDPRLPAPERMPDAINGYLREWRQSPLQAPAAFARCIMESLVLRYGEVLRHLQHLTGNTLEGVHVLGGGARNMRLNQWLTDAFGTPVIAGPTEATALGNALMQLVGLG